MSSSRPDPRTSTELPTTPQSCFTIGTSTSDVLAPRQMWVPVGALVRVQREPEDITCMYESRPCRRSSQAELAGHMTTQCVYAWYGNTTKSTRRVKAGHLARTCKMHSCLVKGVCGRSLVAPRGYSTCTLQVQAPLLPATLFLCPSNQTQLSTNTGQLPMQAICA